MKNKNPKSKIQQIKLFKKSNRIQDGTHLMIYNHDHPESVTAQPMLLLHLKASPSGCLRFLRAAWFKFKNLHELEKEERFLSLPASSIWVITVNDF